MLPFMMTSRRALLLLSVVWSLGCGGCGSASPAPELNSGPIGICAATTAQAPDDPGIHVPQGSALPVTTNPPAAGSHYPVWPPYAQAFPDVVPRGNWLHAAEHGAVVLLYRPADCGASCGELAARLSAIGAALPQDPLCQRPINARWLVTADPLLPEGTAVAAVAWRAIYRARCLDGESLGAFISARYARAPEDLCNDGAIAWR